MTGFHGLKTPSCLETTLFSYNIKLCTIGFHGNLIKLQTVALHLPSGSRITDGINPLHLEIKSLMLMHLLLGQPTILPQVIQTGHAE